MATQEIRKSLHSWTGLRAHRLDHSGDRAHSSERASLKREPACAKLVKTTSRRGRRLPQLVLRCDFAPAAHDRDGLTQGPAEVARHDAVEPGGSRLVGIAEVLHRPREDGVYEQWPSDKSRPASRSCEHR